MGLDRQIKRFFPAILCGFIALAAYFQASGIAQLLAWAVTETDEPPPAAAAAARAGVLQPTSKSGDAILARNPFDSVTGPLDGRAVPIPEAPVAEEAVVDGDASDDDPACGFGRVVLISAAEDPAWSFASITDDKGESKLRRIGDPVGSHTIQAMAWDRVWLSDKSTRCQMRLGSKETSAPKRMSGTVRSKKPAKRRSSRVLDPKLAAKITKISDDEYNIERSLIDDLLQDQAQLMRSARIVPNKDGAGIKLYGIRGGSLLSHIGLENGDALESINGFDM
ncbi:MAG TPA: general secretion pathway protein GspC, partial [Polyangiaceae bacterium]|nr:general secretion pathway protein GspC [Polyangiaceae bacterium]